MPDLTLIMPFYLNGGMLAQQYEGWLSWPFQLRERTEFIIVDDGSPEPAKDVPAPGGISLRIYRVMEDKPWHQHAARNLGAHEASDSWLLLTDMDHMLEAEQAAELIWRLPDLDHKAIYTLDRLEATTRTPTLDRLGNPKPHPNSFVVTRERFWKIGGYDEDYCGIYGTDGYFRKRAFAKAKRRHLDIPLIRYWRDIIPDASTTTLKRKEGRNPDAKNRVAGRKLAEGDPYSVKTLQFEWERVL